MQNRRFGIAPVEAMASGAPVIAYAKEEFWILLIVLIRKVRQSSKWITFKTVSSRYY